MFGNFPNFIQAEEHNRKLELRTARKETVASCEYNNVNIKTSRNDYNNVNVRNRHKHTDRTTKLLIVILIMFLVAEFPLVNIDVFITFFPQTWAKSLYSLVHRNTMPMQIVLF